MSRQINRIVFLWSTGAEGMEPVHLNKDVFMFPDYLQKHYRCDAEIVYYLPSGKTKLADKKNEVVLTPLCGESFDELCVEYIRQNAKSIDLLILFHFNRFNMSLAGQFKKLNSDGFVLVKLDHNPDTKQSKNFAKNILKAAASRFITWGVDLFTVETKKGFMGVRSKGVQGYRCSEKLVVMPNGIDDELLDIKNSLGGTQKENMFITVGRLGTEQKNNQMFLDALRHLDFKDWKVVFIGPYTDEFKSEYEKFLDQNPLLADKVQLTGNISDRTELCKYYAKAKVFVLTSLFESFGIVLTEALVFGDYILSTDVGAASDITADWRFGSKIESVAELSRHMQEIMDDRQFVDEQLLEEMNSFSENMYWKKVILNVTEKIDKYFEGIK